MAKHLINPLFDNKDYISNTKVITSEPIEAGNSIPLSPISRKPMEMVTCDGIKAWYDHENRLVFPVMKE